MVVGSTVLWARSDREVVDLLKDGQLVLVCSLGDAVADAAGAVGEMAREAARAARPGRGEDKRASERVRRRGRDGRGMGPGTGERNTRMAGLHGWAGGAISPSRFKESLESIARGERGTSSASC